MAVCDTRAECPEDLQNCALPVFKMDCETGLFDLSLNDCEADTDCQIQSQVLMAIYGKARDESYFGNCKGGWWGDTLGVQPIGSKLWTLQGGRATGDSIRKTETYIEAALEPLVSAGMINAVSVNASERGGVIGIDNITITQPDGSNNYSYLWEAGCGV